MYSEITLCFGVLLSVAEIAELFGISDQDEEKKCCFCYDGGRTDMTIKKNRKALDDTSLFIEVVPHDQAENWEKTFEMGALVFIGVKSNLRISKEDDCPMDFLDQIAPERQLLTNQYKELVKTFEDFPHENGDLYLLQNDCHCCT